MACRVEPGTTPQAGSDYRGIYPSWVGQSVSGDLVHVGLYMMDLYIMPLVIMMHECMHYVMMHDA